MKLLKLIPALCILTATALADLPGYMTTNNLVGEDNIYIQWVTHTNALGTDPALGLYKLDPKMGVGLWADVFNTNMFMVGQVQKRWSIPVSVSFASDDLWYEIGDTCTNVPLSYIVKKPVYVTMTNSLGWSENYTATGVTNSYGEVMELNLATNHTSNIVYTVSVDDGIASASDTLNINFYNNMYIGVSTNPVLTGAMVGDTNEMTSMSTTRYVGSAAGIQPLLVSDPAYVHICVPDSTVKSNLIIKVGGYTVAPGSVTNYPVDVVNSVPATNAYTVYTYTEIQSNNTDLVLIDPSAGIALGDEGSSLLSQITTLRDALEAEGVARESGDEGVSAAAAANLAAESSAIASNTTAEIALATNSVVTNLEAQVYTLQTNTEAQLNLKASSNDLQALTALVNSNHYLNQPFSSMLTNSGSVVTLDPSNGPIVGLVITNTGEDVVIGFSANYPTTGVSRVAVEIWPYTTSITADPGTTTNTLMLMTTNKWNSILFRRVNNEKWRGRQ